MSNISSSLNHNSHYITNKTNQNKSLPIEEFTKKSSHFYIMTEGGVPIYSRYGDEMKISSFLAGLSALISKLNYSQGDSKKQDLKYISIGNLIVYVLKIGKIYLVSIDKSSKHVSLLKIENTLHMIFFQLLSILTKDLIPIVERKPYACESQLSGTELLFEQTISYCNTNFPSMITCFESLMIDKDSRIRLKRTLKENLGSGLLNILLSKQGFLSYSTNSYLQALNPKDMLIIYNFIQANESIISTESWTPICLPGISESGYLQMYTNFYIVEGEILIGLVFITESQENNTFLEYSSLSENIINELKMNNIIGNVSSVSSVSSFDDRINDVSSRNLNGFEVNHKENSQFPSVSESFKSKKYSKISKLHNSYMYLRRKSDMNNMNTQSSKENMLFEEFLLKLSFSFEKIKTKTDLFDEANYIVCQNKSLSQCFTKGFLDYEEDEDEGEEEGEGEAKEKTVTVNDDDSRRRVEKKVKNSFINIYQKYLFDSQTGNSKDNSYFLFDVDKPSSSVISLLEYENLVLLCCFSFFKEANDVYSCMNLIVKQIKSNSDQYFIY